MSVSPESHILPPDYCYAATEANTTSNILPEGLYVVSYFIFIGAQKALTRDLYLRARPLAAAGGLIVIDDVLKFRHKMRNFYDYLAEHRIAHHIRLLPDDDDGVMLIQLESFLSK